MKVNVERAACSFVRGVLRVVVGSAIAGTGYLSGLLFSAVVAATGFMAVVEFLAAVMLMIVCIYGIYWFGGAGGFEK